MMAIRCPFCDYVATGDDEFDAGFDLGEHLHEHPDEVETPEDAKRAIAEALEA